MFNGVISIGASGTASLAGTNATGMVSITKLTTGTYRLQMSNNFNYFVGASFNPEAGTSAVAAVADGSFVVGTTYQIATVGTTNWSAIGVPTGFTAAVGTPFVASGTGGAGSGTAKVCLPTNITNVQIVSSSQGLMVNSNVVSGTGAALVLETVAPVAVAFTGSTHTNTTVDAIASTVKLRAGQAIFGAGIPLGATIASVDTAVAITLSAAATATATVPMTALPSVQAADPDPGTIIRFQLYFRSSSIVK